MRSSQMGCVVLLMMLPVFVMCTPAPLVPSLARQGTARLCGPSLGRHTLSSGRGSQGEGRGPAKFRFYSHEVHQLLEPLVNDNLLLHCSMLQPTRKFAMRASGVNTSLNCEGIAGLPELPLNSSSPPCSEKFGWPCLYGEGGRSRSC
nr:uncharacterized protein LOC127296916 [Lolium perenne]XP_051183115.1 uncharacterized protein LOC127296916 [Lolium perenne]